MPEHRRLPRFARPSRAASTWLRRGLILVGGAAAIGVTGLVLATQASAVAAPVDPAPGVQVSVSVSVSVSLPMSRSVPVLDQALDPAAAVVAAAQETVAAPAPEVERVARLLPVAPLVTSPLARPAVLLTRADVVLSLATEPAIRSNASVPADRTAAASPTRSRPSAAPAVGRSSELAVRVGVTQSSDGGSPVGPAGPGGSGGSGGSGWGVAASSSIGARGAGGQVAVGLALAVVAIGPRRLGVGSGHVGLRLARRALDVPVSPA